MTAYERYQTLREISDSIRSVSDWSLPNKVKKVGVPGEVLDADSTLKMAVHLAFLRGLDERVAAVEVEAVGTAERAAIAGLRSDLNTLLSDMAEAQGYPTSYGDLVSSAGMVRYLPLQGDVSFPSPVSDSSASVSLPQTLREDDALERTGSMTVACWLRPAAGLSGYMTVMGYENSPGVDGYELLTSGKGLGVLRAGVGGYDLSASTTEGLVEDEWNHCALTVSTTGVAAFYVNGSALGSDGTVLRPATFGSSSLRLGFRADGHDLPAGSRIAHLSVWNRALPPADIYQLATLV